MRMPYSPIDGTPLSAGRDHEEYRTCYPSRLWYFNPWTGEKRDPRDVDSDPTAVLLLPPGEGVKAAPTPTSPLTHQVAGSHYKNLKIQPIEYIHANGIPFAEGCVIKYVTRWRDKGGIGDLEKAKHFIELLIELETRNGKPS